MIIKVDRDDPFFSSRFMPAAQCWLGGEDQ